MSERTIFLAAVEITDSGQRAAYLEQACGADPNLRAQVESLLNSHQQSSQFLETPAAEHDSQITLVGNAVPDEHDPDRVLNCDDSCTVAELKQYLKPSTRADGLGRLAHYEVEQILGRGAFGIVVRAFDEKLHRVVAIKLLHAELATTSPPRKRFLREARNAAAVRHENIVGIYSVEEEPLPYLVMEYVPGITLQQRLDQHGPLDLPEIIRIGQQVAEGLAAAHAANLIHRDIKPSNILLEEGVVSRAKISDFGLARAVDDASLTQSGLIAGTPLYMAPEQARGEILDHRADLFSLGSVLYQMTSGRPPFRAPNTIAVLKRVCEDTPRPIQDVIPGTPDWLCSIINRLLEKSPDSRFQSAQELVELFSQCQAELTLSGQVTCVPQNSPHPMQVESEKDSESTDERPLPLVAATTLASFVGSAVLFLLIARGIVGWGTELTGWSERTIHGLISAAAMIGMTVGWYAESIAEKYNSQRLAQFLSGIAASACLLAAANGFMSWMKTSSAPVPAVQTDSNGAPVAETTGISLPGSDHPETGSVPGVLPEP